VEVALKNTCTLPLLLMALVAGTDRVPYRLWLFFFSLRMWSLQMTVREKGKSNSESR